MQNSQPMVASEYSAREVAKFIGVLLAIAIISLGLWASIGSGGWLDLARWFMGVFFVVFGGFKLAGYSMFVQMYPSYDIVAKRFKPYAYAYPFIELGLGISFLLNVEPFIINALTVLIMGVGSIGVVQELKRRRGIHCACLGNIIKLPLSTVSLIEDVGMGSMALVMLLLA